MSCPCLLHHADGSTVRVEIVAGLRTIFWTCRVCGGFDSETSQCGSKRNAEVSQAHGGALGRGSSEVVMNPTLRSL